MDSNTIAELNDIGGIDLADIDIKFNDKTVWYLYSLSVVGMNS